MIDAENCDVAALRDEGKLRAVFERVMAELGLKTIGDGVWHKFDGEGGLTGLVMLTESHLACHTYPEYGAATFNLYCCRTRPEWAWEENLRQMIGAEKVSVKKIVRGEKPAARNPKSQSAGGEI